MLLLGLFLPTVYLRFSEPTSARDVEVETDVHGDPESGTAAERSNVV